jgi:probable HAF family extracellular repeat protein
MTVFRSPSGRVLATLTLFLTVALRNERPAAQSAAYAVTDLGIIAVQSAEAHDVNDAGQVVGNSGNKAFLWQDGVMTQLVSLGGTTSIAYAINGAGQIVGQSSTPNNAARHAVLWEGGAIVDLLPGIAYSRATALNNLRHVVGETGTFAFLWRNGDVTELGNLGGAATYANDINDAGEVVGASYTNEATPFGPMAHAYVWRNNVMTDLGVLPGLDDSGAAAINRNGVIVGSSSHTDPDTYEVTSGSFIYQDGMMTALPVPSQESYAGDINDFGVVVGSMRAPGGRSNFHAYVYKNGTVTNLNSLIPSGSDLHLAYARAVNNDGQIVGTAFDSRGSYHAYLLTPVPAGTPLLTMGDASVVEGNSGTKTATFTVTLSPASSQTVTASYSTANETATSGSDYQPASGTLTFAAGQTSQTISVLVNGDRAGEATETFLVNLSQASGAIIGNGQGTGTIVDDEPRVGIGSVSKNEGRNGTTPFIFTVTLSSASEEPVSVNFATQDYGAHAGDDYEAASGTVAFAAGETARTITVNVRGDRIVEWEEVFYVNLTGASGAVISNGRGYGTIRNDDK